MKWSRKSINLSPYQLLILVFLACILLGSVFLKLPQATTESISWIDSVFTATSAMTVTGLIVVDTPQTFTVFGEVVILSLIQLGGLGIMSFAVLIYIMLGRKIGLKERIVIQQALNQTSLGGVVKLVKNLFVFSLIIELLGLLLLATRWVPIYGWEKGLYYSLFHSVSAFNNAGFALWSDSLTQYVGDPIINISISLLFIVGGIGFTVLMDVWKKHNFKQLSLHSKMMLFGTFITSIVAMFFVFVLEYDNPNTLGELTLPNKLWASYFQGVVPRTAGFNTIDITSLNESTAFFIIILMFIGAGSASTGGGIKLTTFMVIVFGVISFLKGQSEVVISNRSLSNTIVYRSLAISSIGMLFIIIAILIINITENTTFLVATFEVISAFGTVGLSMGLTFSLTFVGKIVIIFIMFLGKIGPLTLVFSLAQPKKKQIRFPNEDVLTG
ncbi:TrkH family potassium uptake protein [Aquibacillus sp. 3ASR75-11]|uniref:TrkH family potassium uptake protein n=1 Tax=Terrihalobacillus insolitus TaxID=2950438 RepID=A0A9X3WQU3_9BACI|nr:TrkH family potassium uptake protein [Terrihalobacillus insolitus]MDC3414685.1 TrkH family potassium uptake protein [Terrihalobacillus insolitus]MDC3424202.1 TrkH family potassium uptake protein [Terrihalobacillus insolitus]